MLEGRSRDYVLRRIRTGVLEQASVDLLREVGLNARLDRECFVHDGVTLAYGGGMPRVDCTELTRRRVIVYGEPGSPRPSTTSLGSATAASPTRSARSTIE